MLFTHLPLMLLLLMFTQSPVADTEHSNPSKHSQLSQSLWHNTQICQWGQQHSSEPCFQIANFKTASKTNHFSKQESWDFYNLFLNVQPDVNESLLVADRVTNVLHKLSVTMRSKAFLQVLALALAELIWIPVSTGFACGLKTSWI